jgi:predicted DCC family thiol-disulfide oxidoreductase YuxK
VSVVKEVYLFYDGGCPFCSAYVQSVRIREAAGQLQLVNVRDGGNDIDDVIASGFDLDEGMVLKLGDNYYHADECIHMLALLSSPFNLFNRINALIFRSERLSRILYPPLRTGRNLILTLMGRRKIRKQPT